MPTIGPLIKAICLFLLLSPSYSWADSQAPRSLLDWSTEWTEKKYSRQTNKADKAFYRKQWKSAIQLGERTLEGCPALYVETDPRCITQMKKNIIAYAKTNTIKQHPREITRGYRLAKQELGLTHSATVSSRFYYHKLLQEQDRYLELIPVVIEIIDAEKVLQNDEFRILEWEILLYGLYVVEQKQENIIPTLKRIMDITERIIGLESENFRRAATVLADNYCTEKKYNEFFETIAKYQLDNKCLTRNKTK